MQIDRAIAIVEIALISAITLVVVSIFARVWAGNVVECEPQRVIGDGRYWSFRIIDGRHCWYPGQPGKPKSELRWSPTIEAERPAPATIYDLSPEEIEAIRDRLLETTCCWPELEVKVDE